MTGPPSLAGSPDTQATAAYRRLRAAILEGRLAPGQRLKVQDLAVLCGAGPTPVREALAQLAAEGLARRIEQRGFRVADADPAGLSELVRSRCLVEAAALREAIARGDAAWEDSVAAAERRLARLPRSLDPARYVTNPAWEAAHRRFHQALVSACAATPLMAFCERLRDEAERYRAQANAVAWPGRDVAAEHAAIAEAALDRDADRAVALLAQHLDATGEFVRLALERQAAAPPPRRRSGE
ncbi:GntR family transcriptional regulator [Roseomonas sp. CECT 9278]|uniref:GntR family transcriptional regulator n=1 Tax=Roseomonas sp. CECT 9278 TaxID=2845823 RepID=UPI001E62B774|nr:GntR family transcriptional regulator [Roseomonas sp. CECT 9278]CAH0282420.1 HTH-type transcriptional repressor GlaR [Roseomonas sp. CECT 9278]